MHILDVHIIMHMPDVHLFMHILDVHMFMHILDVHAVNECPDTNWKEPPGVIDYTLGVIDYPAG